MRFYCSLPVEVSLFGSSPKMELVSEKMEDVSVGEDPNKELSEGICQEGNVASGFAKAFVDSVFAAGLGLFASLT